MNAEAVSTPTPGTSGSGRKSGRWRALLAPAGTLVVGCVGVAMVLAANPMSSHGLPMPPCLVHELLGLDCPGCGGTRMVFSLLHGDVLGALHYNAAAVAAIPFVVWSWGAWVLGRWRGRRPRTWQHWRWTPRVVVSVLVLWAVVRNLPFEPFRSLWV